MNIQSALPSRGSVQLDATRSTASLVGWGTLYVAGDTRLLDLPNIAVVGSRRASHEGRALAAGVACELVRRGLVVLSGLAAGIDATAHETAMLEGGRTIAVIGTSIHEPASSGWLPRSAAEECWLGASQPRWRRWRRDPWLNEVWW